MVFFEEIALRSNRNGNPRLLSLILHFNPPYRLEFPVFGVGLYRGVPVHQSCTGCGHDYGRLVYYPRAKSGFPPFCPPRGFQRSNLKKIASRCISSVTREAVYQFSGHSIVWSGGNRRNKQTHTHQRTNKLSFLLMKEIRDNESQFCYEL